MGNVCAQLIVPILIVYMRIKLNVHESKWSGDWQKMQFDEDYNNL